MSAIFYKITMFRVIKTSYNLIDGSPAGEVCCGRRRRSLQGVIMWSRFNLYGVFYDTTVCGGLNPGNVERGLTDAGLYSRGENLELHHYNN